MKDSYFTALVVKSDCIAVHKMCDQQRISSFSIALAMGLDDFL